MRARRRALAAVAVLGIVAGAGGCRGGDGATTSTSTTNVTAHRLDDELRLDQVQVLGSHNSYHLQPEPALFELIAEFDPATAAGLEYSHPPLPEQLDELGIRQIELDVFADPEGGRYANRALPPVAGLPAASGEPALDEPGFKVLHVQDVDFASTCVTFVACLEQVKGWSDAHPGHVPITILVEAKDDPLDVGVPLDFAEPVPIDAAALDALDAEIRSVFAEDELITPDLVRGDAATLGAAVADHGWPALGAVRGRVLFALDNEGLRDAYLDGHPSLAGRVLFTPSRPGEPDAAFAKLNDPIGDAAAIAAALDAHMLVRTRADADTVQARTNDTSRRDAALASGAQLVSTDYERPNPSFSDYAVAIPGGTPAGCNPVTAPPGCRSTDVEDPQRLAR
jgi:hypothetical protein